MKKIGLLLCLLLFAAFGSANATIITGQGLPTDSAYLTSSTVIDFESIGVQNVPSLSIGDVTFTSDSLIEVDDDYAGNYNTRGLYHITNHGNDPNSFTFNFSGTTDAFAFLFGASDYYWMLTAYSGMTVLDSFNMAPTHGSNAGDYFGIAANGITHATLVNSVSSDYIFIDNFTYNTTSGSPVPEPSTMLLLGAGLLGLAGVTRRKLNK